MSQTIDLLEFLKTHTKIDNSFIDDFFGLYDSKDKYNYCIDLEKIAKWMNAKKGNLKDTLMQSYKQNIDFIIEKPKKSNRSDKGPVNELILLTPKCFKMMAMQSRTKKAVQVREYYYELEQVIDKYKNYIIDGLQSKINRLENNQKPFVNKTSGIIYIIETSDDVGHYKIGKTTNLKNRLNNYSADKKDNIVPLYVYETDDVDKVESCVKNMAKQFQYRKYKEVYKTDINMLKMLINECGEFAEKVNLKIKNKTKNQKGGNYYIAIFKN